MRLFLLFIFLPLAGNAQVSVRSIIEQLDFKGDTIEVVFKYVANSVAYDTKFVDAPPQYHSYEDVLKDVLDDHRGVCMHYATLFDALISELGYESHIISGYTKFMNQPAANVPHAWNAVKVKGQWYLFDPTWASGFVLGNAFHTQYEPAWFKKLPEEFVYSHIPFDPMWQFRRNAASHYEISQNKYDGVQPLDYNAKLIKYNDANELEKLKMDLAHITKAGITNDLIKDKVSYLKEQIAIHQHNQQVYAYNDGIKLLRTAKQEYSIYLSAKQQQFKNWTPEDVTLTLRSFSEKVKAAHEQLSRLKVTNKRLEQSINENISVTAQLLTVIKQEEEFVNNYF